MISSFRLGLLTDAKPTQDDLLERWDDAVRLVSAAGGHLVSYRVVSETDPDCGWFTKFDVWFRG